MATTPVYVFALWKVKEGNIQAVLKLLKEVHSKTILEQGQMLLRSRHT